MTQSFWRSGPLWRRKVTYRSTFASRRPLRQNFCDFGAVVPAVKSGFQPTSAPAKNGLHTLLRSLLRALLRFSGEVSNVRNKLLPALSARVVCVQ
jgi:hypothetical protein